MVEAVKNAPSTAADIAQQKLEQAIGRAGKYLTFKLGIEDNTFLGAS